MTYLIVLLALLNLPLKYVAPTHHETIVECMAAVPSSDRERKPVWDAWCRNHGGAEVAEECKKGYNAELQYPSGGDDEAMALTAPRWICVMPPNQKLRAHSRVTPSTASEARHDGMGVKLTANTKGSPVTTCKLGTEDCLPYMVEGEEPVKARKAKRERIVDITKPTTKTITWSDGTTFPILIYSGDFLSIHGDTANGCDGGCTLVGKKCELKQPEQILTCKPLPEPTPR